MKRAFEICLMTVALCFSSQVMAQAVPEIPFDSVPNLLKIPDPNPQNIQIGEAVGVATNSKGDIFLYTRSGILSYSVGGSRQFGRGAAARLYEFDPNGQFIREIGQGTYAQAFAHTVRVDPQDNIWMIDEGSNEIVEFSPDGRKVLMVLGRKPEAFGEIPGPAPEGKPTPAARGEGGFGGGPFTTFNRETDIAWDKDGNMFVSDGYNNKRVEKFDKNGNFLKAWGSRGEGPGQFEDVHTIQVDHAGNVYVGDRHLKRIQVFDNDGNLKNTYTNVGAPWALCITPGEHQYLYSSNSTGTTDMINGEIYKMELDGKILGKFGRGGKQLKEFMAVHEMDCREPNTLFVGEASNWRVQKLILHPGPGQ